MCVYVKGVWLVLADCLSWQFVANSDFPLHNENKLTCMWCRKGGGPASSFVSRQKKGRERCLWRAGCVLLTRLLVWKDSDLDLHRNVGLR